MMKANRVLFTIATVALAMGLTGCGKDKYDGTYTGYQIRLPAASPSGTPTTNYNYGTTTPASPVTVTLANNGDSVTGTYQVTMSNGVGTSGYNGYNTGNNTGYNNGAYNAGESYQFNASSASAGSLTNVMMIPTTVAYGSLNSNCGVLQGSLTSQNKGQTLSGTLSPLPGAASNCGALQLQLTRGN